MAEDQCAMFDKILIANRGEIACRIIRTAHRLGIECVAVYSTADSNSLHVSLADSAFCIGHPDAASSYLNIDAIMAAALKSGAQAIHPGYGFLSENPDFARACAEAGIVFVGPSIPALETMGSKQLSKQMLQKTDVPLTPGYHGKDQSDKRLHKEAEQIGLPVLLKAANGGGGKGMRAVHDLSDFEQALAAARRESIACFGDDTLLIEKLVHNPRHVELQIMADNHGQIVHLFERDCSIQRRHQKIIEEAPAPNLPPALREAMAGAAITVAQAIDYRGAGTVEFLVDEKHQFYFMEMNTRLQVEHPVTEMITGLDLVEWQLRIANNEHLPCAQSKIHAHGHAMECRIYAEDPQHGFIPSTGQLHFLQTPAGDGIRIDTGVTLNSTISMYYDPMIAKLIAWGETREEARLRMEQALRHYHIGGVKTNISFLQAIFRHPKFIDAKANTGFLDNETLDMPSTDISLALSMAACVDYLAAKQTSDSLHADTFGWQNHLDSHWDNRYSLDGEEHTVRVTPGIMDQVTLEVGNHKATWKAGKTDNLLHMDNGEQTQKIFFERVKNKRIFYTESGPVTVEQLDAQHSAAAHPLAGQLTAPMPATVVAILKTVGDTIKTGDCLMVLEAMKMEHSIHAPADGRLTDIFYDIGAQVHEGAQLVALEVDKA
jgi:3-methylcrotonyl-CoA carboxylase alpha subunit